MPQHQVHCVVCAKPMRKVTVAGGIEIDCCDEHGVWLDVGEMAALLNHRATESASAAAQQPPAGSKQKSMLEGVGKRVVSGAAYGAGWGVGSTVASALIRKVLG
ncbi:MAG: zf-TFIIB domain-containing protein [Myxococcota bacterium]